MECLNPPLEEVPEGEWFCPKCEAEAEAVPDETDDKKSGAGGKESTPKVAKRKTAEENGAKGERVAFARS